MKVLHLRATNFYGGPEKQLHYHARMVNGSQFEIILSSFSENGLQPEFLDVAAEDGIPIKLFEVKNAYDPKAVTLLRNYLKESRINILCTHDYRTSLIGWRARKGTDSIWIAFSRGWTRDNCKVRLYNWMDRFILRFADHIVAVSHSQKKKLCKLLIDHKKISVVHNAVAPEEFVSIDPVDLRRKYDFPREAVICISGGRFTKEKGQTDLVKAARLAIKKNSLLRFILFGDGPELPVIKTTISNMNLTDKIICPGFEKNMIGHLKGADILVNPSHSEGLPNIVLEAMAVGVSVIATAVGGVPEIIDNELSGLLVPKGDSNSLTDAIIKLTDDINMREKFKKAGLAGIKKSFLFEKQNSELIQIYRQILTISDKKND